MVRVVAGPASDVGDELWNAASLESEVTPGRHVDPGSEKRHHHSPPSFLRGWRRVKSPFLGGRGHPIGFLV